MNDDGPSVEPGQRTKWDGPWREIISQSVADFVNGVSEHLEARYDRGLRAQLYDMVFSNGATPVIWRGVTYTGPMMLDLHRAAKREQLQR